MTSQLKKLEDETDYRALVKARKANTGKPTYTLEQVKKELVRGQKPKRP